MKATKQKKELFSSEDQIGNKRKMILSLGILLTVGFLIAGLVSYLVSRSSIRDSIIYNELPLASDNIYSEIQRDLLQPILIASMMANNSFLKKWVGDGEEDVACLQEYLSNIRREYGTITAFFVSDKTSNYYHSEGILKKVSPKEPRDEWYYRIRSMKDPYEISVDLDMANKDTMTIFINYRVLDKEGNYIGATGVGLTVNSVNNIINTYRQRFNRNIYFFNKKGEIVLQSSGNEPGNPKSRINDIPGLEHFSGQILNGELRNFEYRHSGSSVLLNIRYIPHLNWYLVLEQVKDNTAGILRQTFLINLLIGFVVSIIVLGVMRVTIIRYQASLENRNLELEGKNIKINEQRSLLEDQTGQLEKINRELKLLNQEKDEFIGITAHDLKSPLNAVVGFSDLIYSDEETTEPTREIASYILASSQNMVELVNNLLDMREAETPFDLKLEPFDFRDPILKTVQDFTYQAQAKEIKIDLQIPEHPVMTLANEKWMVEIIGNLVSNAIKYSPKQKVVQLKLEQTEKKVLFEVVDQGEGISKEELAELFQKYAKASSNPTGGESSTGLGLYIVRKMADRMGGSAWGESEKGKGSRFFVEFPAT
jgi:signal transduction histidine kinase